MVDIHGKSYSDIIKIKGTDKKIDLTKLEGLQRTEQNKAIFDMVDHNKDGVIDRNEAQSLQGTLLTTSNGNGILSKREANKHYGEQMNAFEEISALADQQKAYEAGSEYVETSGNTSTHYSKGYSYAEMKDGKIVHNTVKGITYTQETDKNGVITTTLDNGITEIQYPDGSSQQIKPDGTIISYDKDGKKTSVIIDGNTTTFPDDNNSITTNIDGDIIQKTSVENGEIIRTDIEYQEGKTIERQYSDVGDNAQLTGITVHEQKDGHNIDTKFASEEDMANNRPSELITDAHNPTQKTVTKYTYNEDGSYTTETTNSAGDKTIKNFNADGTEIVEPAKPEAPTTHKVIKGESITKIVTDALAKQGIENPTPEQLKEAKKEFLEANKDIVKTYKGVKKEWHGNKFFYPDDVVKIPDFAKSNAPETKDEKTYDGGTLPEVVVTAKRPSEETIARKRELQEQLGDQYDVGYDNEGNIEVRDLDGNVLPEATRKANEGVEQPETVETKPEESLSEEENEAIAAFDSDKSGTLNKAEYTATMMKEIESLGIKINDSNRAQIQALIDEAFAVVDAQNKDNELTPAELKQNMNTAIEQLASKIDQLEQQAVNGDITDEGPIQPTPREVVSNGISGSYTILEKDGKLQIIQDFSVQQFQNQAATTFRKGFNSIDIKPDKNGVYHFRGLSDDSYESLSQKVSLRCNILAINTAIYQDLQAKQANGETLTSAEQQFISQYKTLLQNSNLQINAKGELEDIPEEKSQRRK